MNFFYRTFLLFFVFHLPFFGFACDCDFSPFCETVEQITNDSFHTRSFIVKGEVAEKSSEGVVRFEISDVLWGSVAVSRFYIINGNQGACGRQTYDLEKGDELIVTAWFSNNSDTTFLELCIQSVVKIINGKAEIWGVGRALKQVALSDLNKEAGCEKLLIKSLQVYFKVFPNPAADVLKIETNIENPEAFKIEFYNSLGQIVLIDEGELDGVHEVQLEKLARGIYFIKLTALHRSTIFKIVKGV